MTEFRDFDIGLVSGITICIIAFTIYLLIGAP